MLLPFVENLVELSGPFEEAIAAEFTLRLVDDSECRGDSVKGIPIFQEILDSTL